MSSKANAPTTTSAIPAVVRDPRFAAGRAQVGRPPSIDLFATLLQQAQTTYGDTHIETAPAFYEYGNALFRVAQRQEQDNTVEQQKEAAATAVVTSRDAAAAAAEKRAETSSDTASNGVVDNVKSKLVIPETDSKCENTGEEEEEPTSERSLQDGVEDDYKLALEMMENCWSILDNEQQAATDSAACAYLDWVAQQIPRVLTGIGDVLSALGRHPDACDTYLRALQHRQDTLQQRLDQDRASKNSTDTTSADLLECRRKVVEASVLVVEELLACPRDKDVVTSESEVVLVQANSVVEYARGYYDKAKDELQETVLLLGQLAASGTEIGEEKENICFVATMVMGVGTALAQLDEEAADMEEKPPAKKLKT